jgi:hypothetical protein
MTHLLFQQNLISFLQRRKIRFSPKTIKSYLKDSARKMPFTRRAFTGKELRVPEGVISTERNGFFLK